MRNPRLFAFALLFVPLIGWTEGAVKSLDCEVRVSCDEAARCEDASRAVAFRMEPIELDDQWRGRYTIRYDGTEAPMEGVSELGPFVWAIGAERHVLAISSESRWLWHVLTTEPVPASSIHFMDCEFQG
jgi:hypothetical protein